MIIGEDRLLQTPIYKVDNLGVPNLYVKREDLIPFSFGGNKARKSILFFDEVDRGGYDSVVTYGTTSSNHCRVVSNFCAARGIECYIISPQEKAISTFNKQMMKLFGANIEFVPLHDVHETIEATIEGLKRKGKNPYFIPGGGHGNIGTKAYVQCYQEICKKEVELGISFDYIFFASGTGTTQAGLICGKLLNGDKKTITGISIARKNPYGRDVILECVKDYLKCKVNDDVIQDATILLDEYSDSYGAYNQEIWDCIKFVMIKTGIPLDCTYTGKAFWGMMEYIKLHGIADKIFLFIHTGGTPLYFDALQMEINGI